MKDLSVIKGIDAEKALTYFDGDQGIFDEILQVAVDDAEKKLSRLQKAFDEKDISNYQIEVHSIKSSAAIFGIESLSSHAKKHETAAKDKNFDFIASDYNNLVEEFKNFISQATIYLGK